MNYNLFIDDERDPIDVTWGSVGVKHIYKNNDWIIARNWIEVLDLVLSMGFPDMISFDHDLGHDEPSGHEISKKLIHMIMDGVEAPENLVIHYHSKNPVGAENMRGLWESFKKQRNIK